MLKTSSYSKHTDYYQLWLEKKKENVLLSSQLFKSRKMVAELQLQLAEFFRNMNILEAHLRFNQEEEENVSDVPRDESDASRKQSETLAEDTVCDTPSQIIQPSQVEVVVIEDPPPAAVKFQTQDHSRTELEPSVVVSEPVQPTLDSLQPSSSSHSQHKPIVPPELTITPIPTPSKGEGSFILPDEGAPAPYEMMEPTVLPEEYQHSQYEEPASSSAAESTSATTSAKLESDSAVPQETCLYKDSRQRRKGRSADSKVQQVLVPTESATTIETCLDPIDTVIVKMEVSDDEIIEEFSATSVPCEGSEQSSKFLASYAKDSLETYQVALMESSSDNSYQNIEGYSLEESEERVRPYKRMRGLDESSSSSRHIPESMAQSTIDLFSASEPGSSNALRLSGIELGENSRSQGRRSLTRSHISRTGPEDISQTVLYQGRSKKTLSLPRKVEILQIYESSSKSMTDLAKDLNIPFSTLRTIIVDKERIWAAYQSAKATNNPSNMKIRYFSRPARYQTLSLTQKVDILRKWENSGKSCQVFAQESNIPVSSLRKLKLNKAKLLAAYFQSEQNCQT